MTTQELSSSGNAVFKLYVHLVLVTKYRRRVFTAASVDRCRAILSDTAAAWGCEVVEAEGEADHVHVLLSLLPRVRPSDIVNNLKTVTSRRLRSEFPSIRAAYGRKAVLWSPSYCLISAGGAPISVLKQYIQNQERPV